MSKTFSEKLKSAMNECNLTQSQLAEKAGVSTRTIQRYIYGESEPGGLVLERIADALHIHPEDLKDVHIMYDKDEDLYKVRTAIRRNLAIWTSEEKQLIIQEIMNYR